MSHAAYEYIQRGPAVVHLNVGGTLFQTSRETLLKDDAAGVRDLLVAGGSGKLRFDSSGHLFLDTNPRTFEVVLDFLRDGAAALPRTQFELQKLGIDAHKFQVFELEAQIVSALQQVHTHPAGMSAVQQLYPSQELPLGPCIPMTLSGSSPLPAAIPASRGLPHSSSGCKLSSALSFRGHCSLPLPTAPQSQASGAAAAAASSQGNAATAAAAAAAATAAATGAGIPRRASLSTLPSLQLDSSQEVGSSLSGPHHKRKRSYFEYAKKDWELDEQFRLPVPLPDGSTHWAVVEAGDPECGDRGRVLCRLCCYFNSPGQFSSGGGYSGGKKSGLVQHQTRNRDHQRNVQQLFSLDPQLANHSAQHQALPSPLCSITPKCQTRQPLLQQQQQQQLNGAEEGSGLPAMETPDQTHQGTQLLTPSTPAAPPATPSGPPASPRTTTQPSSLITTPQAGAERIAAADRGATCPPFAPDNPAGSAASGAELAHPGDDPVGVGGAAGVSPEVRAVSRGGAAVCTTGNEVPASSSCPAGGLPAAARQLFPAHQLHIVAAGGDCAGAAPSRPVTTSAEDGCTVQEPRVTAGIGGVRLDAGFGARFPTNADLVQGGVECVLPTSCPPSWDQLLSLSGQTQQHSLHAFPPRQGHALQAPPSAHFVDTLLAHHLQDCTPQHSPRGSSFGEGLPGRGSASSSHCSPAGSPSKLGPSLAPLHVPPTLSSLHINTSCSSLHQANGSVSSRATTKESSPINIGSTTPADAPQRSSIRGAAVSHGPAPEQRLSMLFAQCIQPQLLEQQAQQEAGAAQHPQQARQQQHLQEQAQHMQQQIEEQLLGQGHSPSCSSLLGSLLGGGGLERLSSLLSTGGLDRLPLGPQDAGGISGAGLADMEGPLSEGSARPPPQQLALSEVLSPSPLADIGSSHTPAPLSPAGSPSPPGSPCGVVASQQQLQQQHFGHSHRCPQQHNRDMPGMSAHVTPCGDVGQCKDLPGVAASVSLTLAAAPGAQTDAACGFGRGSTTQEGGPAHPPAWMPACSMGASSARCASPQLSSLQDTALLKLIHQSSIGASLPMLADLDDILAMGEEQMV